MRGETGKSAVGICARGFAAGLALSLLTPAFAEPPPVLRQDKDEAGKPLPFGRPAYQPPSTPLGTGPFSAVMAEDPGLPDHTLYYPKDLAKTGKLPIVTWGNGACINAGNRFRIFLTEMASHGYLIISGGPIAAAKYEVGPQENPPVPAPGSPSAPPPSPPLPADPKPGDAIGRNTVPQLIAAIDWAVAENERPGSKFYHRLDVQAIGVAGQSCGGSLAAQVSADPRIKATILFSGAPRLGPTAPAPGRLPAPDPKAVLDAVHAPTLILAGDAEHDIAHAPSLEAAAYLKRVPVFAAWQSGLTHIGTYGAAHGGQLARLGWQWFDWRLKGDGTAAAVFRGQNCVLCGESSWHITKGRID